MGNTPSNIGDGNSEPGAVESITFTNNHYQKQQNQQYHNRQHDNYTHQRHYSSPNAFPTSLGPQDSINPSTIPIAPIPVDGPQRPRFPYVKEQYINESPAGSSPLSSDSSYPIVAGEEHSLGDKHFQQRRTHQHQQPQKSSLPGGGPRRRASSLASGQVYGQYADSYNEQVLLATAAHQDKIEQQRLQQQAMEGRASYRNSARVSRAFDTLDPLKSLDDQNTDLADDGHVPTIITWSQGGNNVYVTGTFNNWKQKVRLNKSTSDFTTILNLPPGTHRIKFIVDDEWKCSTELSAATDAEGNLVNFLEVADEEQDELEGGHDSPINGSPVGSYTDQIPLYAQSGGSSPASPTGSDAVLPLTAVNSEANGNSASSNVSNGRSRSGSTTSSSSSSKFMHANSISNDPPPALPPHLEKVILNNVPSKEDNSVLPVPNHVVLNHLYACSVKEGVLSISVTARYRKKYITTVFIKPVVTD
ncbi:galactose metabolism- protein [Entomortierella chlamydospora]|uniref:Galactose metabolism- protein n=1 Tax=Entomortierella chlamydospora TaxID=101097 RepID=A0A9P6N0Y6_9FUNG|nr:galactose metabolism- protein [Entomortierella chlamydospora]